MKSIKNHFANINKTFKVTPPPSGFVKDNGFTIIEVALVLAIAGLIFLVVFLALPALQNSQKDTARRQDVGRVVAALQSYEADGGSLTILGGPNGNSYHSNGVNDSTFSSYVGKLSQATNVIIWYNGSIGLSWAKTAQNRHLFVGITVGQTCSAIGASSASSSNSSPDAAVWYILSNDAVYCVDM